jgi:VWFA-related protein
MGRKFFLLFDFAFIDPHGVLKAKTAGLHFMDAELRPDDQVGLLTYTAFKGLVLHEYLTADHAKVRCLVDGFGLRHLVGRAENLTDFIYSADLQEQTAAPPGSVSPEREASASEGFFQRQARLQTGQSVDEGARQSYIDRARQFIESLDNFARVLRYIPGYKHIILFSGGLAQQVLFGRKGGAALGSWSNPDELAAQLSSYDSSQPDTGLRGDYTNMLQQFRASNSPVYTLDMSRTTMEADVTSNEGRGQAAREFDGADSLRQIASGTGGRFYANTVDHKKAMDNIQSITGAYYVLGYSVGEQWDGKFHKIKVRVSRKGCEVMAQGGYFSPKPFKEYTSFEKLLHATDLALSDVPQLQIPAEIPVQAMALTVKGQPQLAAFTRASTAVHGEVLAKKAEAYLLVLDESGEVAVIKRFKLALPEAKAGKDTLLPSFVLPANPGRYTCRIVLRNMETGQGARGSAAVVIPGTTSAPLVVDPPLLLAPDTRSLDLASSEEGLLSVVFAYDSNTYAPLVGAVPAGLKTLFAALRCSSTIPKPDLDISVSVQEAEAPSPAPIPVTILERSQDGPTTVFLLELATGELRAGRFILLVRATDKSGSNAASAKMEFVVK